MAIVNYKKYKIQTTPASGQCPGLKVGDVVRRQYFDSPNLIYSLLLVLETGTELVGGNETHYFIGALLEGAEPQSGELLDFVRITSLVDDDRSGALYLTASDSQAPYIDVIDKIIEEHAIFYPTRDGGEIMKPERSRYTIDKPHVIESEYFPYRDGASRVVRINRKVNASNDIQLDLFQILPFYPDYPDKVVISFRTRCSKPDINVNLTVGFNTTNDCYTNFVIGKEWSFHLYVLSIDHPSDYQRYLRLNYSNVLKEAGGWCEVADFVITPLSAFTAFTESTKARIGKVSGIVDPVYGVLDGYGAYFQNLYATKNVNIAGTLTAGDERGFSSTFYVGKIHKNVIINSLSPSFSGLSPALCDEIPPAGIGDVYQAVASTKILIQSKLWRTQHIGETYCFSLWMKCSEEATVGFYQNEHHFHDIKLRPSDGWQRCHAPVIIKESGEAEMYIRVDSSHPGVYFTSPQLESGSRVSQYQPTDGTLSYVEDYGAWFNKGGIGGTIQNPLIKLNEDGSISSRDGSFVINPDGTGHFSSGRFSWTKDQIILKDVVLRWDELDDKAKENMSPLTLELTSSSGFVIKNGGNDVPVSAILRRAGKEVDPFGSLYEYGWRLMNNDGSEALRTYSGKSIVVSGSDVLNIASLICEVSER